MYTFGNSKSKFNKNYVVWHTSVEHGTWELLTSDPDQSDLDVSASTSNKYKIQDHPQNIQENQLDKMSKQPNRKVQWQNYCDLKLASDPNKSKGKFWTKMPKGQGRWYPKEEDADAYVLSTSKLEKLPQYFKDGPKPPKTPYNIFKHTILTESKFVKSWIPQLWQNMTKEDREEYVELAELDKDRFEKEVEIYWDKQTDKSIRKWIEESNEFTFSLSKGQKRPFSPPGLDQVPQDIRLWDFMTTL